MKKNFEENFENFCWFWWNITLILDLIVVGCQKSGSGWVRVRVVFGFPKMLGYPCLFWDQSLDMCSSGFLPKNRPLIGRPDRSANQRPVFWWETDELMSWRLTLISEKIDFSYQFQSFILKCWKTIRKNSQTKII